MDDYSPPPGDRGGETYEHVFDYVRLNQQATAVWRVMQDRCWHTLHDLSCVTGHPEASVSARLRDFRKDEFGGHVVERERIAESGLFRYRLTPNPYVLVDGAGERGLYEQIREALFAQKFDRMPDWFLDAVEEFLTAPSRRLGRDIIQAFEELGGFWS